MTLIDANIALARIAIAEEQYILHNSLILVWKAVHYLYEANYIIDLLNTTAANFFIEHDQVGKPSVPIRMGLKVESNNDTGNILGERSFEVELQELRRVPGPSRERPMLDDVLDQVFLASAPCSLPNAPALPELATYEVGPYSRSFEVELTLVSL